MSDWSIVIDVIAILASFTVFVFSLLTYRLTRANGLGFTALGFLWITVARTSALFGDTFFSDHSRQIATPAYVFLGIGAVLLYTTLKKYYVKRPNPLDRAEEEDA